MKTLKSFLKNHINLIGIILAVLVLVLVGYFKIIKPLKVSNAEKLSQIKSKVKLIETSESVVSQKEALNQRFDYLTKKIQARLPVEREESQFLNAIQRVAQENNIHIASMNPLPLRDLGSFKELSVEIDMEANLGNIVRFLYYMRESSVVLVANRLRLEPISERSALLDGHLVISTIFLKEK